MQPPVMIRRTRWSFQMDIDVEPEDLTTNGDLNEVIVGGAPSPMVPIMTVMGILLRVEVTLKEADTLDYARRG